MWDPNSISRFNLVGLKSKVEEMLNKCKKICIILALGATQPWTWWFQERPATRQRPEDRQAAREAREMERLLLQKQRR